jgi:hypothetical protein
METGDKRKECCKLIENLELQQNDKPDLTIQKCKVCGCRHFEVTLDPGSLGLVGGRVG